MKDLAGKVAFVTGSASGIGLTMARSFSRERVGDEPRAEVAFAAVQPSSSLTLAACSAPSAMPHAKASGRFE